MKCEKILGIRWKENKDVLIIDLKELLDRALCYMPTKRSILRVIAGIYDPVGFIQPLVVILFQSKVAYRCCVNVKYITLSGNIDVSLIASKLRIVPKKKKFTIPRLELLGNYILGRLTASVLSAFSNEIVIDNVYRWTDSQISLA